MDQNVVTSSKKKIGVIIAAFAVLVIACVVAFGFRSRGVSPEIRQKLELASKYLEEFDFERALAAYDEVLSIDPVNADAYLGIVEVYIRQNDFDTALDYATKGYELTKDERLKEKIEMLESGNIYDSNGNSHKLTITDATGRIKWWHELTYNKQGKADTVTHYSGNGSVLGKVVLEYDAEGNTLVDYGYTSEDGTLQIRRKVYENGLCVKTIWESLDGKVDREERYEYDEKGFLVKQYNKQVSGDFETYSVFQNDDQGRAIRRDEYDAKTDMHYGYLLSEYDKNGNMTVQAYYSADDMMQWKNEYEYDKDGTWIEMKTYDGNGNLTQTMSNH